ncbi:MAG TPA: DUF2723 domain-containing protein [Phycisphaerae bacterium]|jgi:hypothetical protein|nr:DUF2723 domain-containing protein [Phycisphaerae bacterium]HOB73115.1 DUF2723 domain-containing protein [Phycisphaerae bacterium]HOJ54005.1 DUF2723 domain-containing protein [Phycisphaerae bacterium]HOL26416.1 DUF2723 domain-containing protein [Phycisphaerae bacterium]HPP20395.1 DUF2723 domain-containing protein [Phycisphaerae bacterium]
MLHSPAIEEPDRPVSSARPILVGWILVFVSALALYALTANRGVQWQDSGDIALRIYRGDLTNPLGLALVHALHFWLGRFALAVSNVEPVFAITLVSAVAAAMAVANLFGCVMTATRNLPSALFAAASLAVANTFWRLATVTEVYTLTAALLAGECWCLLALAGGAGRYALWGMLLFNGLGVGNHLQAGLTTPVVVVVAVQAWRAGRVRLADLLIGVALWFAGTLPYTILVLQELYRSGDWLGTIKSALVGNFGASVANAGLPLQFTAVSIAFLFFSFPNLLLPAAVYGLVKGPLTGVPIMARRALLAGLILHALFVLRYNVQDQYTFLLPVFVLLCIFGGFGAAMTRRWNPSIMRRGITAGAVILLAVTPLVYWGTASLLRHYGLFHGTLHRKHAKPYRDAYEYLLIPWSVVEDSADRMSREAIELAGAGGLIVTEDSMARFALQYRQMRSAMAGVEIENWSSLPEAQTELLERMRRKVAAGRRVVLVPLNRDAPAVPPPGEAWERKGDLYVLISF